MSVSILFSQSWMEMVFKQLDSKLQLIDNNRHQTSIIILDDFHTYLDALELTRCLNTNNSRGSLVFTRRLKNAIDRYVDLKRNHSLSLIACNMTPIDQDILRHCMEILDLFINLNQSSNFGLTSGLFT